MKDWHSPRQSDSLRDVSAYARKCAVEFDVTESWARGPSVSQCLLLLRGSKIDIVLNIKHNTEGTTVNPLPGPALSIDIQLSSLWKSSTSALHTGYCWSPAVSECTRGWCEDNTLWCCPKKSLLLENKNIVRQARTEWPGNEKTAGRWKLFVKAIAGIFINYFRKYGM